MPKIDNLYEAWQASDNMANKLEIELQQIGLDRREAKVYLSALELGPSPVQKIAQRSGVPRATTYLVLDDLRDKGFVTTYEEGKKTFFVAESPERLLILLDERETEFNRQRETIKKLIPELISRGQFEKGKRPVVRYYEGAPAIAAYFRDTLKGRGGEILGILHLDKAEKILQQVDFPIEQVRAMRSKKRISSRVIYTTERGPLSGYSTKDRQAKYVSFDQYPFEADIALRDNTAYFVPYGLPLRGVAIEDKAIVQSLRQVFELLWSQLA
ncbi:MAG: hypothetical protein COT71_03190 [Candidatus Andersenbacteria bacterium CG10_big_fil_rev_8_21_14_0_10_54_11]|uniref:Transcription regulator TrmB N-terminal domain-containing protein n=1 Tax=Candidatus Andersenbacteria bacterium CG10_big_fil_rev_8_21_14_0_10_54_11 TaxID=1974485 RepID=A0A2M6WYQ1_9BACT|nr:MAG: hypothetical protein COT71_03190 [Candidatus Andersenbacteria bacterium CG10_big_fil_rev_8_21_14_0_10_54_11]